MIKLNRISKVVENNKDYVNILKNIDLEVHENDFLVVVGKSGSGKTSILNIIGGFDKASNGEYTFEGKSIKSESDRLNLRKEYCGYVTQNYALINDETVKNNILLALAVSSNLKKYENDLDKILEELDITDLKNTKVSKLSGGEKQRVAIARAIIKRPKVLILDEPTGNLDYENSELVIEIIKKIHNNGTTIILVTHDLDYMDLGNRSVSMKDGSII